MNIVFNSPFLFPKRYVDSMHPRLMSLIKSRHYLLATSLGGFVCLSFFQRLFFICRKVSLAHIQKNKIKGVQLGKADFTFYEHIKTVHEHRGTFHILQFSLVSQISCSVICLFPFPDT